MATISGKDGNLTIDAVQVCPVTNWTLTRTSNNDSYAANDTGGKKARKAGVKDVSGTFEIKDSDPPVAEGDEVTIVMFNGATDFTEEALIDEISTECDINEGTIVTWTVTWSGTVITPVCSSSAA